MYKWEHESTLFLFEIELALKEKERSVNYKIVKYDVQLNVVRLCALKWHATILYFSLFYQTLFESLEMQGRLSGIAWSLKSIMLVQNVYRITLIQEKITYVYILIHFSYNIFPVLYYHLFISVIAVGGPPWRLDHRGSVYTKRKKYYAI